MRKTTAKRAAMLVGLGLFTACAPWQPVMQPVEVRLQSDSPDAAVVEYYCEKGECRVGRDVHLDERDVRGVMLQDGESQGLLVLQFTDDGKRKLGVMARGQSPGRSLVVVHDGKALIGSAISKSAQTGELHLRGPKKPMRTLYQRLTRRPKASKSEARKKRVPPPLPVPAPPQGR